MTFDSKTMLLCAVAVVPLSVSSLHAQTPAAAQPAPSSAPVEDATISPAASIASPPAAQPTTPGVAGHTAQEAGAAGDAAPSAGGIEDIVVTARRSTENIQSVPVSVTAFSPRSLSEKTVFDVRSLTQAVPGVTFSSSGASYNVNLTIRGQTRAVTGAGLPAVVTYFNEVPLLTNGSNIPTFDLSSVQVLKGPQGTFFGRNTTGGLLLTYSQIPEYHFGGYMQGSYGNYNDRRIEGAVNIPIITDKVALRVAGELARHDGYTKNESGGPNFDNLNRDSVRVSLLVTPTDWLTNLTVYDYSRTHNTGEGATPTAVNPGGAGQTIPFLQPYFDCGTSPNCDARLALARAQQSGPYKQWTDLPDTFEKVAIAGVSNTTTLDLGKVSIKNIFGYRTVKVDDYLDDDGTTLPLLIGRQVNPQAQITEELQIYGKLLDDRLDWRIGGFYLHDHADGNADDLETVYQTPFSASSGGFLDQHNYYSDTSKAVFGTITVDLGDWLKGLKFNMGGRYTEDTQTLCSDSSPTTANNVLVHVDESSCNVDPTRFQGKTRSKEPTYTFGFDYQATRDLFLYVTKRRGYRGGGINSPKLGGMLTPYQNYSPEFVNDYEIGVKANWHAGSWTGRFDVSLYTGQYTNIQTDIVVPVGFDGDSNPADDPTNNALTINRGKARIRGIDMLAVVSPIPKLSFTVTGSYTDAQYTDLAVPVLFQKPNVGGVNSANFSNQPKWTWTANGRYATDLGSLGTMVGNVDFYYSSKVYYQDLIAPHYHTVNARLELENAFRSGFDLALFGRNLTNERYIEAGILTTTALDLQTAHYGDPRTFGVQVTYRF